MASSAQTLRELLEAEGATFSSVIQAIPLPFVGGGMGVVATASVQSGDTLSVFPYRSMLTTAKARFNLALVEVTLRGFSDRTMDGSQNQPVLQFIAEPPDLDELQSPSHCWCGYDFYKLLQATVDHLKQRLSATETMTCFIMLLASLYRKVDTEEITSITKTEKVNGTGFAHRYEHSVRMDGAARLSETTVLHHTSENVWMLEWMRALPASYDNLFELFLGKDATVGEMGSGLEVDSSPVRESVLTQTLWFKRHRTKLLSEKAGLVKLYRHCLDVLLCLRELPVDISDEEARFVSKLAQDDCAMKLVAFVQKNNCCTFDQFLWAYSTLMSRGFAFEDEVWAMMPWADYFNHALDANCTMFVRRCHPKKWSGVRGGGGSVRCADSGGSAENDLRMPYSILKDLFRNGGLSSRSSLSTLEYVFQAVTTIEVGEQVSITYGSYCDFESLLWYGFIQRPYLLPVTEIISVSVQDPRRLIFFPSGRHAQQFLGDMDIDAREVSHLHAVLPRLQDEGFRQVAFEHYWKHRRASSVKRTGGRLEYDKWQRALQNAFAFVFSPLQNAEGAFPNAAEANTWMHELVNDFLRTPAKLTPLDSPDAHGVNRIFPEKSARLDAWCRCFVQHWQVSLSVTVSLTDYYGNSPQKCTLGVFGPSSYMQECIQRIARACWVQLKSRSPSHTFSRVPALPLYSFEETKIALLRAIAWMEFYSNYCFYDDGMGWTNPETASNDSLLANSPDISPTEATKDFSVHSMARTVSLDAWLLLQYLALEASDHELLAYLNFEST